MDNPLSLLLLKFLDWPTILAGISAGLLAWSGWSVAVAAIMAAIAAEVILMQVRGWPIRPYWIVVGLVAVLPWTALGFALRSLLALSLRKLRPRA